MINLLIILKEYYIPILLTSWDADTFFDTRKGKEIRHFEDEEEGKLFTTKLAK